MAALCLDLLLEQSAVVGSRRKISENFVFVAFIFYEETAAAAEISLLLWHLRGLFMVRKSPRRVNFFGKKWDFYGKKFTDSLIMVQKSAA